jgi:homoserine acetyltransferase
MIDKLLEKLNETDFEDNFKPISPEEMEERFENMSEKDLAEYILEDALMGMRTPSYNELFSSLGGFDDEAVQEAMENFLEKEVEDMDKDDMLSFLDDIKSFKIRDMQSRGKRKRR